MIMHIESMKLSEVSLSSEFKRMKIMNEIVYPLRKMNNGLLVAGLQNIFRQFGLIIGSEELQNKRYGKSTVAKASTNFRLALQTTALKSKEDYLAPDRSEIRLLPTIKGGGLCHCTLPAGKTSSPVAYYHVEEIWYVLEGEGEVWRRNEEVEEIISVKAGISLTIPPDTAFQFRNTGTEPLCILIATMPPWPGEQEANKDVVGIWTPTVRANAK
jgi:mannose-6-phosphate isomerase-like protein (cupin superfamily)